MAARRLIPLADKARGDDLAHLSDRDLLVLVLDQGPIDAPEGRAESLLRHFGNLVGVVGAPLIELSRQIGAETAFDLKLLHEVSVRMALAPLRGREIMSSQAAVADYLKVLLAGQPREQVWVLFLDKKNQLLVSEKLAEGTVDHAPVYPREVVRRALEVNCSAFILVHNHPSGDPTPSAADIAMTREVIAAAQALRIAVHDHMVVGRGQVVSLRNLGLISPWPR